MRFWRRRGIPQSEVESSRKALALIRAREERVAEVVEMADQARTRNHFGERFHQAMEGKIQ